MDHYVEHNTLQNTITLITSLTLHWQTLGADILIMGETSEVFQSKDVVQTLPGYLRLPGLSQVCHRDVCLVLSIGHLDLTNKESLGLPCSYSVRAEMRSP